MKPGPTVLVGRPSVAYSGAAIFVGPSTPCLAALLQAMSSRPKACTAQASSASASPGGGHIGARELRLPARLLNQPHGLVAGGIVVVGHQQLHALLCTPHRDGPADTGTRARQAPVTSAIFPCSVEPSFLS